MGRLGKADFKQLKALHERIDKLSKVDFDRFYTEAAKDIASRLLTKVKKRTPVDTGALWRNWGVSIEHQGDQYVITVINGLMYASYVEYGHRTANHKGWVEGRFMLTISVQELERIAPALLEKRLLKFLKGCFDAE